MLVALRLLQYLGFKRVYLFGADFKMSVDRKYAFDEGRTDRAIQHNNTLYEALDKRFASLRGPFKKAGFQMFNCTPGSGLTAFERMDFDEAVERASAECAKPVSTEGWYT